jgi:hypothetical protein
MFSIGQPSILTHGRAKLRKWLRSALVGLVVGLALMVAGGRGQGRSWSFLTIVFGLWLTLVMAVRMAFLWWAIRATRIP